MLYLIYDIYDYVNCVKVFLFALFVCVLFRATQQKMQRRDEMSDEEMLDYLENIITYFQSSMSNMYGITTAITVYRNREQRNTINFHGDVVTTRRSLDELKIAFIVDFEDTVVSPSSPTVELLRSLSVVGNRRYCDTIKSFSISTLVDRGEDISSLSLDQRRVDEMKLLTTVNQYLNRSLCDEDFLDYEESFFLFTTATMFGKHYAPLLMTARRLDQRKMDVLVDIIRKQVEERNR